MVAFFLHATSTQEKSEPGIVSLRVPEGAVEGQVIHIRVQDTNDTLLQFTVPEGKEPGDLLRLQLPNSLQANKEGLSNRAPGDRLARPLGGCEPGHECSAAPVIPEPGIVSLRVPEGALEGQVIHIRVQGTNDTVLQFTVPEGKEPGDLLRLQLPDSLQANEEALSIGALGDSLARPLGGCEPGHECSAVPVIPAALNASRRMEYRYLGRSGLLVSRLSYGAWITFGGAVDEDRAFKIMKLCLDAGINMFDNAEAYNDGLAEVVMGQALKRLEKEYPLPRSHVVITTKIFFGTARGSKKPNSRWVPNTKGLSRKHVVEGLKASLKRLQLSYVDVVFAHRPDMHTPMEEIVRAFTHVIDQGMAFYWCTSEWSAEQIQQAIMVANHRGLIAPVCEQPQYNMLHRERFEVEYAPLYSAYDYGTTIWSSLSSGVLTGKYNDGIPEGSRLSLESAAYILRGFKDATRHTGLGWDAILDRVRRLQPVADRLQCTMAQLAVAWVLKNERVTTVILGATKLHQLEDSFGSLAVVERLDTATMAEIDSILANAPAGVRDWNPNPSSH